jgi:hypothetical protein
MRVVARPQWTLARAVIAILALMICLSLLFIGGSITDAHWLIGLGGVLWAGSLAMINWTVDKFGKTPSGDYVTIGHDIHRIPEIANVQISTFGLHIEGLRPTIARTGIKRASLAAGEKQVVVVTHHPKTTFTFDLEDGVEGRGFLTALGFGQVDHEHPRIAAIVARQGRSAIEWVRALRAIGAGSAEYRDAAIEPGDLLRVVEDAGADDETRIAAAIAIAPSLDPETRTRVLESASRDAPPRVRVALLAAANADEDVVALALEDAASPARRKM